MKTSLFNVLWIADQINVLDDGDYAIRAKYDIVDGMPGPGPVVLKLSVERGVAADPQAEVLLSLAQQEVIVQEDGSFWARDAKDSPWKFQVMQMRALTAADLELCFANVKANKGVLPLGACMLKHKYG
jgi:hypothetical protein